MPRAGKGIGIPRSYKTPDRYCEAGHDTAEFGRYTNGKCFECIRIEQGLAFKEWSSSRSKKDKELLKYIPAIHPTREGRANQISNKILEEIDKLEHCMPWEKEKIQSLIRTLQSLQ